MSIPFRFDKPSSNALPSVLRVTEDFPSKPQYLWRRCYAATPCLENGEEGQEGFGERLSAVQWQTMGEGMELQSQSQREREPLFYFGVSEAQHRPETEETQTSLKDRGNRVKFTQTEDETLSQLVTKHGRDWALIASLMPGKNRKQLRERYVNFLIKKLNRAPFTPAEDARILELIATFGKKFAVIAEQMEGRTAVMIKNHYYTKLRPPKSRPRAATHPL